MDKWIWKNGIPPESIPDWLDPDCEVTRANDTPKIPPGEFGALMVNLSLDQGCSLKRACEVAANVYNESNTGRSYRANNPFGWKVTKGQAEDWKKAHETPTSWYRAPGNKSSGDPPVCYYRGFPDLSYAVAAWFRLFVPVPGSVGKKHRYYLTGKTFWETEEDWFPLLIDAGYKGEKTRTIPERKAGSIAEHRLYCRSAEGYFVQDRLGVSPLDGVVGPQTQRYLRAFQAVVQPPGYVQGTLDNATLTSLWKTSREACRAMTGRGMLLLRLER